MWSFYSLSKRETFFLSRGGVNPLILGLSYGLSFECLAPMKTSLETYLLLFLFFSSAVLSEERACQLEPEILDESLIVDLVAVSAQNRDNHTTEEIIIEISLADYLDESGERPFGQPIEGLGIESLLNSPDNARFTLRPDFGVSLFEGNERLSTTTARPRRDSEQSQDEAIQEAIFRVGILVHSRNQLAHDKHLHFVVGAGISEVTRHSVRGFLPEGREGDRLASAIAFGVTTAVGIAKEIRDLQGFGTPEVADAVWTSAGSGLTLMRLRNEF